jgi:hypothetical protein
MRNPNMREHHKDQLLDALMYYLPIEVRGKIINEVPAAYNDYHGREIAVVVRADEMTRRFSN